MDVSGQLYRRLLLSGAVGAVTADCFSLLPKLNMSCTASLYVLEKCHAGNQAVLPRSYNPFPGHYIDRVISVGVFQNNFPLRLTLQCRAVAATNLSFRSTLRKRKAASHFKAPDFDCSRAAGRAFRRSATVLCRLS
jgi:hypothetical protein